MRSDLNQRKPELVHEEKNSDRRQHLAEQTECQLTQLGLSEKIPQTLGEQDSKAKQTKRSGIGTGQKRKD